MLNYLRNAQTFSWWYRRLKTEINVKQSFTVIQGDTLSEKRRRGTTYHYKKFQCRSSCKSLISTINTGVVWSQGTPRIPIPCIPYSSRLIGLYTLLLLTVWVYRHSDFCLWLRKTQVYFCAAECGMTLQGHPMSLILSPTRYDFLLVLNSNHRPILSRFRDIRSFVPSKATFPYPIYSPLKILGCSFCSIRVVGVCSAGRVNRLG